MKIPLCFAEPLRIATAPFNTLVKNDLPLGDLKILMYRQMCAVIYLLTLNNSAPYHWAGCAEQG